MSDDFSVENVPAIAISFDHQIEQGRIIRFQTGVAQDADAPTINALLDKLTAAADRQEAKYKLEHLTKQLASEEKLYVAQQEDMVRLDEEARIAHETSGRKGPWGLDKLQGSQRKDRENAEVSISRRRDMIKSIREQVAAARALVDGAHGSTNSH